MDPESNKGNNEDLGDGITRKDYDDLKSRSRNLEGKLVDYEKTINSFGGVEKIKGMQADLEALKRQIAGKSTDDLDTWQKEKEAEIRNSIQKDLDTVSQRALTAEQRLHQLEVVDKVIEQWAGKFLPSAMPLIKEIYIKNHTGKDDQGFFVKDDKGEIRFKGAKRMTEQDYYTEIAEKHPDLLAGQRATGTQQRGGNSNSNGTQAPGKMPDVTNMTKAEMIKAFGQAGSALDYK